MKKLDPAYIRVRDEKMRRWTLENAARLSPGIVEECGKIAEVKARALPADYEP